MKASAVNRVRITVQLGFLAFVTIVVLAKEGWIPFFASPPSLHAICPFGGVETLYTYWTSGLFVRKIHESSYVLMWGLLLGAILTGAGFCGWVCPLGTVQELLGRLRRRLGVKEWHVPEKLSRILSYFKYVVLLWVLVVTARSLELVFQDYDPYYALFNFWTGEVALSALIILGVTLVLGFFIERAWCRFACPLGAVLGLFNKISLFTIKRNQSTCIGCNLCSRTCKVGIPVSKTAAVGSTACTRCLECLESCPVPSTLELRSIGNEGGRSHVEA